MCRKFRSVVCCNGLQAFLVWQQQFPDRLCQRLCLLPKWQFLHKQHIGGLLHQREYGMLVRVYDQVHLKISESLSVNFLTSFMDAHPVFDWKMSALGTMPIFHLMPCVLGKFPCCVIVDNVTDGLVGHLYPLFLAQIPRREMRTTSRRGRTLLLHFVLELAVYFRLAHTSAFARCSLR